MRFTWTWSTPAFRSLSQKRKPKNRWMRVQERIDVPLEVQAAVNQATSGGAWHINDLTFADSGFP
jgi:hypothetical protein